MSLWAAPLLLDADGQRRNSSESKNVFLDADGKSGARPDSGNSYFCKFPELNIIIGVSSTLEVVKGFK